MATIKWTPPTMWYGAKNEGSQGDYDLWRTNFGRTSPGAAGLDQAAIPEPATCFLLVAAAFALPLSIRRTR